MEKVIHYYYLRDTYQPCIPRGCVALHENEDGSVNRGVSYCSTNDNFSKKKARSLALKRLSLADNGLELHFGANYFGRCRNMPFNKYPFDMASAKNVPPTDFELRLLHKPGEK